MPEEAPPKSAYELAMERLRALDREAGVEEHRPLTNRQKRGIAKLRREAKAKLAELEIMHRRNRGATGGDPDKLKELEEHYRIDRARVESRLESAVARIRKNAGD